METIKPSVFTMNILCRIVDTIIGHDDVKIIFEFGSRYGEDSIEFAKRYPNAHIYGFECNETTLPECRKNVANYSNITLTEKAVIDNDESISFYPIDKDKTETTWIDGNQGASSLFKASGKYEIENYVQREVVVDGISLKTFMLQNCIDEIDVMWMDVQGAELLALQGLSTKIDSLKIIQLEVEFFEMYSGQPLFDELKIFLERKGFYFAGFSTYNKYSGDAIFIRNTLLSVQIKIELRRWLMGRERFGYWKKTKSSIFRLAAPIILRGLSFIKYSRGFEKTFPITLPDINSEKSRQLWKLKVWDPLLGIDVQFRKKVNCEVPIDVIIPTVLKDADILSLNVASIKKYVKHPIGNIFIVAPNESRIRAIVKELGCIYIDENSLFEDFLKTDINYEVEGEDRSGWLFQQLIKLQSDKIATYEHFLIVDSDTIFNHPVKFIDGNKMILNYSDEHHDPYFYVYQKLLRENEVTPFSFVAHHMLFNKSILRELKNNLEMIHQKNWLFAILDNVDYTNNSGFSEYETYGNFALSHFKKRVKLEYWFNKSITSIEEMSSVPIYSKTVSIHSYNRSKERGDHV